MSALQVLEDNYSALVESLPMNDALFIAKLHSEHLLPRELKNKLKLLTTKAEKATEFLDQIIEPSLRENDVTLLEKLLVLMENNGIKELAQIIRTALEHGSLPCSGDTNNDDDDDDDDEPVAIEVGKKRAKSSKGKMEETKRLVRPGTTIMDAKSSSSTSFTIIPNDKKSNDTLTMKDLHQYVCKQYASQWELLASFLGLEDYHIDNISKDNEHNPNRSVTCCTAVLKMWLKKTASPTWGILDNAVKNLLNKIQMISNTTGDGQLQQATDYVKAWYRRKKLTKHSIEQDPWPPFQIDSFINLVIIHQKVKKLPAKKEARNVARMRIVGNIDNIPELTSSIKLDNIHQIFTSISSDDQFPMSILIEGHPGIGKTTLAKEICLQWATNNLLTSDKMLIFLMLRDPIIQNIDAIEELIKYALPAVHVKPVLHYLHAANGAGFTFIIDGFDELSNKLQSKSLFRKLIEGDVLPNARVVITSRPFVSACLHQYVNRRIEVLGFEKSSKEKYTEDALIDHPNELQNLRAHFQLYPNIEAMCYIPLNMAIIIYLCQVGCLPPTATEMFKNFVLHIICRHLKREKQISEDTIIGSIKHLPQPIQKALHKLEEVAFDGLVKDKLVFTKNDLPEMCKENPTCYGLLQSIECFCSEEIGATTLSLNFLHLGIQEYFAANYVRTLSQENIFALLEESFLCNEYSSTLHPVLDPNSKSVHLSNMWILYCGITGGQCKSLSRYLSVYNLSLQGVEEYGDRDYTDDYYDYRYGVRINDRVLSNNVNDCSVDHAITNNNDDVDDHGDSILDDMDDTNDVDKDNPKFPHYHNPEKYTEKYDDNGSFNKVNDTDQELNNTQTISQIILADPVKVLYLFQCFQEAQNDSMCEILSKSYWNSNNLNVSLLPHQVVSLGFFLSKSTKTMTHLNMSNCHIGDHGIKLLHHYLCENKQEMERLDFSYNDLTEASSIIIGDIIIYLKPRMLILCNNSITELKDISTAVIHTKSLKELWITSNGLAAHKAMPIADMITSLEVLFISFNKLGDNGAIFLSEGIKRSYTLKKLNIQYNDIGATGATAIANSLMQNTSLQELDMDHNVISESGATAIGLTLTKNSTLTKLEIGNNKIGREGAIAIAKSLPQNYTLKALYMNNNAIGQDGAIAIAHCLSGNISLMILNLCNNDIDPSRATMIVKMITENRTMQNLDVSNGGHGSKTQSVLVKETRSRSIEANNNFNDNASLKVLNVNNAIDQSGVVSVANFLIKNSSLRMLHMNTNAIGQDGARAIAKSLMFNDFLKVLSMNNNSIGQGGAIAIADCLIQNTSLEMLEINENCIGHEGAIAIANSLAKNKSLQVLHMNENKIGPNGAMAIAEALCQNTSLDILHINSNAIGEDGAAAIAKSIKHNTSVWNLHMDNNSIGNCGAEAIAMNIGNNKELQLLSLCDDNTINEESAAKIVKNLHCNNTITGLKLPIGVCNSYVVQREVESINDTRIKSNVKKLKVYCIP